MTRLTLSNDQVMIYDDFLPADAFASLAGYVSSAGYRLVHKEQWHKSWHVTDGLTWIGEPTYFRGNGAYRPNETSRYPTQTPIDALFEAVDRVADDAAPLVGERDVRWKGMALWPFIHPRGTGLSLHRDHTDYSGAIIYYVHPEWDIHWGGHLLVLDSRTGAGVGFYEPSLYTFLSDEHENRLVSEPGLGLCILPKPNRLVFMKDTAFHMVTRVDADAGDRPRVALSGFFVTEAIS